MKSIIVYDSNYGNTKQVAEAIAKALEAKAYPVSGFDGKNLDKVELIVIGSPIIGWRPSENMGKFLESLKQDQLKGVKAAAFDTRIKTWFSGDASKKIASLLEKAGAVLAVPPQQFYVTGKEGPLADGEIEKAKKWALSIKQLAD